MSFNSGSKVSAEIEDLFVKRFKEDFERRHSRFIKLLEVGIWADDPTYQYSAGVLTVRDNDYRDIAYIWGQNYWLHRGVYRNTEWIINHSDVISEDDKLRIIQNMNLFI